MRQVICLGFIKVGSMFKDKVHRAEERDSTPIL